MSVLRRGGRRRSEQPWLSVDDLRLVAELLEGALAATDDERRRDRLVELQTHVARQLPDEGGPVTLRVDPGYMHELAEAEGGWPEVDTASHLVAAMETQGRRAALEERDRERVRERG